MSTWKSHVLPMFLGSVSDLLMLMYNMIDNANVEDRSGRMTSWNTGRLSKLVMP